MMTRGRGERATGTVTFCPVHDRDRAPTRLRAAPPNEGGRRGRVDDVDGRLGSIDIVFGQANYLPRVRIIRADHFSSDPLDPHGLAARASAVTGGEGNGAGHTWGWDGRLRTQRQNMGPPARNFHDLAYHSDRDRVVLFGGRGERRTGNQTDVVSLGDS